MITYFKVLSGYAAEIERLKKEIQFKPGLNILFGPNGCGKSSTIKIAGAYCSIKTAGWTDFQDPFCVKTNNYRDTFKTISPGKCEAEVEWDGTPTLLADTSASDITQYSYFYDSLKDSPDGMTSMTDQLTVMKIKPSTGMLRFQQLKKYDSALNEPPDLTKLPERAKNYNNVWLDAYRKFIDYVKPLNKTGIITFMMDEPDRSLSIEAQYAFWTNYIPKLLKKYNVQLIVATHCMFALSHTNANWIEFEPNGVEKCFNIFKKFASDCGIGGCC